MMTISVQRSFDMGHRLYSYAGKCYRLHGHTYRGVFTFKRKLTTPGVDKRGMVADFAEVKPCIDVVLKKYDHYLALWRKDPLATSINEEHLVLLEAEPTVENLCRLISWEVNDLVERELKEVSLIKLKLWETENCYAEYHNLPSGS